MDLPTWLVLVALVVILIIVATELSRTLYLLLGVPEGPMPVPSRVAVTLAWAIVAVDLVGHGWWPWALAPMVFAALSPMAGWIHHRVVEPLLA